MSKRVQMGWFGIYLTLFLTQLNSTPSAQTDSSALQSRPEAIRAVYRYPAMYAQVRLSDRKLSSDLKPGDSNEPLHALVYLVRKNPDQRLFTLDWQTEKPSVLYRTHFDRKRSMLWFHMIEMTNDLLAVNKCYLFRKVRTSAFKSLGILDKKDFNEKLASTKTNKYNRKDRFLLRFNALLKQGCESAVLPSNEIPNFGSRRELFP